MPKENKTEFIILGLLTHENLSGYDLKKQIDMMISHFWEVGYGQLYPTLKSLEEEGFITGVSAESSKGPDRIVYSITGSGKAKLTEWLLLPAQKENVKYEILLKVFFGSLLPTAETIMKIEEFKQRGAGNLQLLSQYRQNLQAVLDESDDHLYFYLTVLFGEHIYQAYVDWAEEAKRLLQEHAEKKSTRG
jgi:DNA-binding PadR family transcriptional regulator